MTSIFFTPNGIAGFDLEISVIEENSNIQQILDSDTTISLTRVNLYNYYRVNTASIHISPNIEVHLAILSTEKSGILKEISLYIKKERFNDLLNDLREAYGTEKLQSSTSISDLQSHGHTFWKIGLMSVFLTYRERSNYVELSFSKMHYDDKKPHYTIHE